MINSYVSVAETGNAETVIWLSSNHKAVYPEPGRFKLPPERNPIGTHRNKVNLRSRLNGNSAPPGQWQSLNTLSSPDGGHHITYPRTMGHMWIAQQEPALPGRLTLLSMIHELNRFVV